MAEINSSELPSLFTDICLLNTFFNFTKEEAWLLKKSLSIKTYLDFITPFLEIELKELPAFHDFIKNSDHHKRDALISRSNSLEKEILLQIKNQTYPTRKEIIRTILERVMMFYEHEERLLAKNMASGSFHGMSLYRTYDNLDSLFDLTYESEKKMEQKIGELERPYEGSGIGVQSGYSTIINALRILNPQNGSTIIDLGSGHGRLGFVIGILRPDISFIGYEYVDHRTESAKKIAVNFELTKSVKFITQNLADKDFKIPSADHFYLYDPFTESTYTHVLNQLVKISETKKIVVITKGNSRLWLSKISAEKGWPPPILLENGSLCIFNSR